MTDILTILADHGVEAGNFKIEWTPMLGWRVECGSQWVVFQSNLSVDKVITASIAFMLRSAKPIQPPTEVRSDTGDSY